MHLQNDTLLQGGKYKIVRFLSSGGFGCTYEAEHTQFQTRVAIKEFFVKDFCNRADTGEVSLATQSKASLVDKLRKKFVEEARVVFQMHHHHIVRMIDIFEENGTAYYVMDYIDGQSLHDMVKNRGKLPENEAVKYIEQVADALKYVHSLNRLHLDVKPGNIMVDKEGNAILIDFGASKHYDDESGENTSTLMGVNTQGYAPIEQMNASFTNFSPATDIYSLGATLYKMLTGVTPPNSLSLMSEDETLSPLPLSISENVRKALNAAMQLKRKDRPQSIEEFISILEKQDEGETEMDSTDIESIIKTAEQGDAEAQYTLSCCYGEGNGVQQDAVQAVYWSRKAAEQGYAPAQYSLGCCYGDGEGVQKDDIHAVYWMMKAAEQGFAPAQHSLGCCYGDGVGVQQDATRAVYWCRKAAEQGFSPAQYMLGFCYDEGLGVTQSYSEAIKWYKMAAEQGNADAIEALKNKKSTNHIADEVTELDMSKTTSNLINGHEFVDLGLSVKWATCNVGANSPSDYGDYYAWGETSTKSSYNKRNSATREKSIISIEGKSQYDVARAKWGGTWRLPTEDEIDELINNCTHVWTTQGGRNGYKITGPNGNIIFLPAAGWRSGTSLYRTGKNGYYWSATAYEADTRTAYGLSFGKNYFNDLFRSTPYESNPSEMYVLRLQSGCFFKYWHSRFPGQSVRPVSK